MSELCCAKLIFDVPYSRQSVRRVLEACAAAVKENWALADQWTRNDGSPRIDVDEWIVQGSEDKLEKAVWADEVWETKCFDYGYSPTSFQVCMVSFSKEGRSGSLGLHMCVPEWSVKYEVRGYREIQRMELEWEDVRRARGEESFAKVGPDENDPSFKEWWERHNELEETPAVWPQNRKCFIDIVEKVRSLFPVKEMRLDPVLQETV